MKPAVSVTNLRLAFSGEKSLLFKDLSVSIEHGEKVLLLGPSGSGKSTLLQVLTGLIPELIEVPIKHDDIQLPESWGFLFQDPETQFCMPYADEEIAFVLENLGVPQNEMPARIKAALKKVGLKLDDVHAAISTMSQGMKQRLALASILALEPEVLFLDEPSALLDPEGAEQIWTAIKESIQDKTAIIVEHQLDHVVDFIDRVIMFNDQGEIVADGPKDFVFTQYKQWMDEQGIWSPGVWERYIYSTRYRRLDAQQASTKTNTLLTLQNFRGFRGKQQKIEVPQATVGEGEWIAITGPNGAGKSTLLLSLMQLTRTEGHYDIQGQSVSTIKNLSEKIAFVFQNPEMQFVTNSVYEEVAFSLRKENRMDEAKVEELLSLFHLSAKRLSHPYQLSLGQKRRLSVAAAVVMAQPIILLDEPTFGQDAQNTFAILEKLEQWRKQGTTIVMVTHDMEIVRFFATRVWHVAEGKLVSDEAVVPEGVAVL